MTIVTSPSDIGLCSAHGDLIFPISGPHATDPVTYPNYKYLLDIYIGGVLVKPLKVAPHPDTLLGIFNIGPIVRNYVATQLSLPDSGLVVQTFGNGEFSVEVTIKVGEEYGFVEYPNIVTPSPETYYNYYTGPILNAPAPLTPMQDQPASTGPLVRTTRKEDKYNFLPFFNSNGSDIPLIAEAFVNGVGQGDVSYSVPGAVGMQLLNLSFANLNDYFPGLAMPADTDSFTIQFADQLFIYNIVDECIFTPYTLHFLNQWGGFETFPFRKLSRKTSDLTRKTFQQLPYRISGAGALSYGASTPDGAVLWDNTTTYASNFKDKLKIGSDLLTDQEWTWLKQLVVSPQVYLDDNSGYLIPVTIQSSNYEEKRYVNDRLQSLQLDLDLGPQLNAQFR